MTTDKNVTEHKRIVDGQTIFVREAGPPGAPLAFLIHGWSSSSHTWSTLMPTLQRRYRCVAVDLPGFGKSPDPVESPSIAWYADLIAELIKLYKSDRGVAVIGHSMGGQIATTLALRHPALVEQLVLLNPALSGRLSARVNFVFGPHVILERVPVLEWVIEWLSRTRLDYTDWVLKPSNFAETAAISPETYQQIRADARRVGQGKTRLRCFLAMREGDLRGKLAQIEHPTLVLWGAEDNVVPLRDAGIVDREWDKADLRILPNAGHWPQFEQPDATIRHISNFLGLPPALPSQTSVNDDLLFLGEVATFLNNSEIGGNLTLSQRQRLASLLHSHGYSPGEEIAVMNSEGHEMYMVKGGQLDVWLSPALPDGSKGEPVLLASVNAGQVAGELALLDHSPRSADLRAGPTGAQLLTLTEEALLQLAEEDPLMGMQLMQNLAISLGKRLRNQNRRAAQAEQEMLAARV
jgi:pimeloyl-ACP methyl ester carboxylesterase/CRP-like cAMP-binding protein